MNIIATEKAPGAIGPYSQAYEVNGVIYTSGQIPVESVQTGKYCRRNCSTGLSRAANNVGAILEGSRKWL